MQIHFVLLIKKKNIDDITIIIIIFFNEVPHLIAMLLFVKLEKQILSI